MEDLVLGFSQEGVDRIVVEGVSFALDAGECLALVGESGSGKSVTALAAMRLLSPQARILRGRVRLHDEDLLALPESQMETVRGRRIGMVFQDPMAALNPVMTIGQQLLEAISGEMRATPSLRSKALELLDQVGLSDPSRQFSAYPHQLSGGMRQRVLIAQALAGDPDLLIADEPTTALDVLLQAQIMGLLNQLRKDRGMALWLITHDLASVHGVADRVIVMREGKVVESAGNDFFSGPKTSYGRELLTAIPRLSACLDRMDLKDDADRKSPVLSIRDLSIAYPSPRRWFSRKSAVSPVVRGVSFDLFEGETLAVVGGSGCGKTSLARGLLGLVNLPSGRIEVDGVTLGQRKGRLIRHPAIQVVFQDPYASMNPRMVVSSILEEGLRALLPELSAVARNLRILECLEAVGLNATVLERYPHEFSGGQRQRLCIARSLLVRPKILILDEPTSALDVTVQAQVLGLLKALRSRFGLSYLFITHDLGVVAQMADRVAVMHQGAVVEMGHTRDILMAPRHAVTQHLIEAMPALRRAMVPEAEVRMSFAVRSD
jgi:ABC-type microcin C transport system duplicated ATPase subunit YejF